MRLFLETTGIIVAITIIAQIVGKLFVKDTEKNGGDA